MREFLATVIQDTVGDQAEWLAYGGEHASLNELNGNLIVRAPHDYHREIDALLGRFRELMIDRLARSLSESAIKELLEKADRLRFDGDYAGALKVVDRAMSLNREHPGAVALRKVIVETMRNKARDQ